MTPSHAVERHGHGRRTGHATRGHLGWLCGIASSDEECSRKGEVRDGCRHQDCPGRGAREVEDCGKVSTGEDGSQSECSLRQVCRASEAAPQMPASLFDMPTPATTPTAAPAEPEDDPGFAEIDDDEPIEEVEELDDAA